MNQNSIERLVSRLKLDFPRLSISTSSSWLQTIFQGPDWTYVLGSGVSATLVFTDDSEDDLRRSGRYDMSTVWSCPTSVITASEITSALYDACPKQSVWEIGVGNMARNLEDTAEGKAAISNFGRDFILWGDRAIMASLTMLVRRKCLVKVSFDACDSGDRAAFGIIMALCAQHLANESNRALDHYEGQLKHYSNALGEVIEPVGSEHLGVDLLSFFRTRVGLAYLNAHAALAWRGFEY